MNKKLPSVISSIFNSFCDFSLDIAVNKFDTYSVLLYTSIISLIIQIIVAYCSDFTVTIASLPVILIYGSVSLLGYLCYVKALKKLPIGLTALLENLDIFLVLIIDIMLGNLVLSFNFVLFFLLFVFSVVWFILETNKVKEEIKLKKIEYIGIVFILLSVFFYGLEPYIIKWANNLGANAIAINFGYSVFAIPFFLIKSGKENSSSKLDKKFYLLIATIGFFEATYYIFGTLGYIYETPIIANIIQEIRVFLLVILSVLFKTDKMTIKKLLAIILGILSIVGICSI